MTTTNESAPGTQQLRRYVKLSCQPESFEISDRRNVTSTVRPSPDAVSESSGNAKSARCELLDGSARSPLGFQTPVSSHSETSLERHFCAVGDVCSEPSRTRSS